MERGADTSCERLARNPRGLGGWDAAATEVHTASVALLLLAQELDDVNLIGYIVNP